MSFAKKRDDAIRISLGCFFFFITGYFPSSVLAAANISASPPAQQTDSISSQAEFPASELEARPVKKIPPTISKPTILPDDENNIRLLQLSVGPYTFDDLIMVYQYGDILFIPFGTFSELIDLAIKAGPSSGIAKGYVFNEKKTFYLDINRGEITLSGVKKSFDNSRTAARELDDIYVDSNLLSEWLPLMIDASDDKIINPLRIPKDPGLGRQ